MGGGNMAACIIIFKEKQCIAEVYMPDLEEIVSDMVTSGVANLLSQMRIEQRNTEILISRSHKFHCQKLNGGEKEDHLRLASSFTGSSGHEWPG
jgi:hypothetical protein